MFPQKIFKVGEDLDDLLIKACNSALSGRDLKIRIADDQYIDRRPIAIGHDRGLYFPTIRPEDYTK